MTDDAAAARRRIAVKLEYDGAAYRGSQLQDNGPSIQSELEAAIEQLTHERRRVSFAGRTDAGVHALGQVAVFDTASTLAVSDLRRGLDHFLPQDIAVRALREAPASFDPRRDAVLRRYRYLVDERAVRSPLLRGRVWHVGRTLDREAMSRAAALFVGAHDFAAYCAPLEASTARTVRRCDVTEWCGLVAVEMEAQAFLPHQVRRTVGPLVEVGLGRRDVPTLETWLREAQPSVAGPSAPACGLYLLDIEYDGFAFGPDGDDG